MCGLYIVLFLTAAILGFVDILFVALVSLPFAIGIVYLVTFAMRIGNSPPSEADIRLSGYWTRRALVLLALAVGGQVLRIVSDLSSDPASALLAGGEWMVNIAFFWLIWRLWRDVRRGSRASRGDSTPVDIGQSPLI